MGMTNATPGAVAGFCEEKPMRQLLNAAAVHCDESRNCFVRLSDKKPFAGGSRRVVYRHPSDESLILKLSRPKTLKEHKSKKPFRLWMHSADYYNYALREYRAYLDAVARGCPLVLRHIPKYSGIVHTDIGKAVVVQFIRRADGSPALGLNEELERNNGWTPALRSAFGDFMRCVRNDEWQCCDFEMQNLLVADTDEGGKRIYHSEYSPKRKGLYMFAWHRRRKKEAAILKRMAPFLRRYL